jgi:hypothetical protein
MVDAGLNQDVTLTFDSTGLAPGTYEAHLRLLEDTPYNVPVVPVKLIVIYKLYLPLVQRAVGN